jgi:hypothetical protein
MDIVISILVDLKPGRLSKKAAGFDKERFKSDVIQLFQKHGLL